MVKVRDNAKYLCEKLKELDFKFITGGTDNHILLIDLRNFNNKLIWPTKIDLTDDKKLQKRIEWVARNENPFLPEFGDDGEEG